MESNVQFFINEYSLQGQFLERSNFVNAVVSLSLLVRRIRKRGFKDCLYKSSHIVNYNAIPGEHFLSSLNRIPQRDIRENFIRIVFDRINPIDWQMQRKHREEDLYVYHGDVVTGTSIAELAERKLLESRLAGCLLNFIESSLPNGETVSIVKNENEDEVATLDSFDELDTIERWFDGLFELGIEEYSIDSTEPPMDEQTVLRDTYRFRPLKKRCQGRVIYEELSTRNLWYVDNEHFGQAAHLETFDKRGKHLGEANLEGVLRVQTKVEGRNIRDLI